MRPRLISDSLLFLVGSGSLATGRFVALALVARALSVEGLGAVVLIQAFALLLDRALNFQSWIFLVRYGSATSDLGKEESLAPLVAAAVVLDLSTAFVAFLVAISLLPIIAGTLNLPTNLVTIGQVYCLSILFNVTGAPSGMLRLSRRWDILSLQQGILGGLLALAPILGSIGSEGLTVARTLSLFLCAEVAGVLLLWGFAVSVVGGRVRRGIASLHIADVKQTLKEVWPMAWRTNVSGGVRLVSRELDILAVSAFLGPAASGTYKIVKQVALLPLMATDALYSTVYPEFSRWAVNGEYLAIRASIHRLTKSAAFLVALYIAIFAAVGNALIVWIFGGNYDGAFHVAMVYLIGVAIAASTFAITPALLAMGGEKQTLRNLIMATLVYMTALPVLLPVFGLLGAAAAYGLFYATWLTVSLLALRSFLGDVH